MCGHINSNSYRNQSRYVDQNIDGCSGIVSNDIKKIGEESKIAVLSQELTDVGDSEKSLNNRFKLGSTTEDETKNKGKNLKRQVDWHWINACIGK